MDPQPQVWSGSATAAQPNVSGASVGAPFPKPPEVLHTSACIDEALLAVENRIDALAMKLAPILADSPVVDDTLAVPREGKTTDLGRALDGYVCRIEALSYRVAALLDRTEV